MTYDQLIAHFETMSKAARAIGTDRQVVYGWGQRDRIPLEQQIKIEVASRGRLRADVPDEFRSICRRKAS